MRKGLIIASLLSIVTLCSCSGSTQPEPTESPTATPAQTFTSAPTATPVPTTDPAVAAQQELENSVYNYLDNLLQSSDNPAMWADIGSDVAAWQKKVEEYEDNATKETAEVFGMTVDEVNEIYIRKTVGY